MFFCWLMCGCDCFFCFVWVLFINFKFSVCIFLSFVLVIEWLTLWFWSDIIVMNLYTFFQFLILQMSNNIEGKWKTVLVKLIDVIENILCLILLLLFFLIIVFTVCFVCFFLLSLAISNKLCAHNFQPVS
jgi:hypothetical protein